MVNTSNKIPIPTSKQDIDEVSNIQRWPPGTKLQKGPRSFKYSLAGTDLKAGNRAYGNLTPPIGPPYNGEQLLRDFWGNLRSKPSKGSRLAGIPLVDVCRGQYCWIFTAGL